MFFFLLSAQPKPIPSSHARATQSSSPHRHRVESNMSESSHSERDSMKKIYKTRENNGTLSRQTEQVASVVGETRSFGVFVSTIKHLINYTFGRRELCKHFSICKYTPAVLAKV